MFSKILGYLPRNRRLDEDRLRLQLNHELLAHEPIENGGTPRWLENEKYAEAALAS